MSRALRRHHRKRIARNRRHYWGGYAYELSPLQVGKIVATPHPCSRDCCTNRRRVWKERTVQELRFECVDQSAG